MEMIVLMRIMDAGSSKDVNGLGLGRFHGGSGAGLN